MMVTSGFCCAGSAMFDGEHMLIGVAVILVDVTRLRQADELKSGLVSTFRTNCEPR